MKVNGQLLKMVALPPGQEIRTGRWLGQRAELEALEKKKKTNILSCREPNHDPTFVRPEA
jgi:hypothetical protein